MLSVLPVLLVGFVIAGYLVNSFVITTDVIEPFTVEYAILGNGGNWDGTTTCDNYTGTWQTGQDVDVGGLYAGEGRMVCTRITNAGEGDIDYKFKGEVVSGLGNLDECQYAFGTHEVTGIVPGLSTITDGVAVVVAGDAAPVLDCQITLSTLRG